MQAGRAKAVWLRFESRLIAGPSCLPITHSVALSDRRSC